MRAAEWVADTLRIDPLAYLAADEPTAVLYLTCAIIRANRKAGHTTLEDLLGA